MRVLFVTVPWPTHFHAMVPLAWAFRAAGHEVRVASGPALAETIAGSGLPAVVVGRNFDFLDLIRNEMKEVYDLDFSRVKPAEAEERAVRMLGIFAKISGALIDDLVLLARTWRPELVVYEPTMVAAPIAAAVLGVPTVRHLWGPDITYGTDHLQGRVLGPLLSRFGLSKVETLGSLTVDPSPPSLRTPAPIRRQVMRYIPFNGSGSIPRWLSEPPILPRILVTWGTAMTRVGKPEAFRLPEAAKAVADLDAEVVVAVTAEQLDLLGSLPGNVEVLESVPLHAVMPTCAAVVHHGGSGTTLTAAAAGVPQLVVSQSPDQMVNAAQIQASGSGIMLLPKGEDPLTLGGEIKRLTRKLLEEPGYRSASLRMRAELEEQPGPDEVVPVLERLAHGRLVPA